MHSIFISRHLQLLLPTANNSSAPSTIIRLLCDEVVASRVLKSAHEDSNGSHSTSIGAETSVDGLQNFVASTPSPLRSASLQPLFSATFENDKFSSCLSLDFTFSAKIDDAHSMKRDFVPTITSLKDPNSKPLNLGTEFSSIMLTSPFHYAAMSPGQNQCESPAVYR